MPNFDWINPANWIPAFLQVLSDEFAKAYTDVLVSIITLLTTVALPTIETLKNEWFKMGLGSTYGLATQLMSLVSIVVSLYLLVKVRNNNSSLISRLVTNFLFFAVFAALFYPVYSLLVNLTQGVTQAMFNLATGTENATARQVVELVSASVMPENPFGKMITAGLASAFGGIALIEAFALRILLYLLLIFYPLTIVLRVIFKTARVAFNVFNAGILTIALSGPVMALGFLAPALIGKNVPGGDLPIASFVFTIIGGLFAMVVPFVLMWWAYNRSSEVFGRLDATVAGGIDVNSMPPMTMDDMQKDIDDNQSASFKHIVAGSALGASLADDDIYRDMKQVAIDTASTVATTTGHPYIAAGIKIVDHQMKKRSEANDSQPTPSGGD